VKNVTSLSSHLLLGRSGSSGETGAVVTLPEELYSIPPQQLDDQQRRHIQSLKVRKIESMILPKDGLKLHDFQEALVLLAIISDPLIIQSEHHEGSKRIGYTFSWKWRYGVGVYILATVGVKTIIVGLLAVTPIPFGLIQTAYVQYAMQRGYGSGVTLTSLAMIYPVLIVAAEDFLVVRPKKELFTILYAMAEVLCCAVGFYGLMTSDSSLEVITKGIGLLILGDIDNVLLKPVARVIFSRFRSFKLLENETVLMNLEKDWNLPKIWQYVILATAIIWINLMFGFLISGYYFASDGRDVPCLPPHQEIRRDMYNVIYNPNVWIGESNQMRPDSVFRCANTTRLSDGRMLFDVEVSAPP